MVSKNRKAAWPSGTTEALLTSSWEGDPGSAGSVAWFCRLKPGRSCGGLIVRAEGTLLGQCSDVSGQPQEVGRFSLPGTGPWDATFMRCYLCCLDLLGLEARASQCVLPVVTRDVVIAGSKATGSCVFPRTPAKSLEAELGHRSQLFVLFACIN